MQGCAPTSNVVTRNTLGDDVSVLALPGGEPKREGSLISVKEAADSLDNTQVVSDSFMLVSFYNLIPTFMLSRCTMTIFQYASM